MRQRTPHPSLGALTAQRRRRPQVDAPAQSARTRTPAAQRRPYGATTPLPPVSLGGYPFPELSTQWETIPHQAGLFAVLEWLPTAEGYRLLVLDEAADRHEALATLHRRAMAPKVRSRSVLVYATLATDVVRAARQQIVATLRAVSHLPTPPSSALPSWSITHDAASSLSPRLRGRARIP